MLCYRDDQRSSGLKAGDLMDMYKDIVLKANAGRGRYLCLSMLLSSFFILGGCQTLSGSGPRVGQITSESNAQNADYPYQLISLSPQNVVTYSRRPDGEPLKHVVVPAMMDVRLMPGDVLKVMIADDSGDAAVFASLAQGGTTFDKVLVDAYGAISIPYLGKKKVSGLSLSETEDIIRRGLKGRAGEPQVHVELVSDLSGSVLVAGAVKSPGRFSKLKGPLTLLDAINQAGGPVLEPYLINVTLRTGKTVQVFNYQDLLAGGNIPVPPNSEIVLDRARKRFVAMGAVGDPGLHDLPSAAPSLLEVLGSVHGLSERSANPSGVFVFRLSDRNEKNGKKNAQVFHIDMREPASMFVAKDFLILPDDTVYVTNAPVYEMQKIITPIVQVLLLGQRIDSF